MLFPWRRTAARTARPRGSGAGCRGPASDRAGVWGGAPRELRPVVAELERDTEVVFLEHPHGLLEVVFRSRRDADLVALDGGLYLLDFLLFKVLHDFAGPPQ